MIYLVFTLIASWPGPLLALQPARAITVLGPIPAESLGITLMHEHLASNMLLPEVPTGYRGVGPLPPAFARRFQESGRYFRVPRTAERLAFWDRPGLTSGMVDTLALGWLTKSQFVLDDDEAALAELSAFRAAGGRTVVDVTTVGIGRDPARLARLARQSGVNVVMGTGWYRWMFHPPDIARATIAELADRMVKEITVGVGATGIRAGIIGEIPVDAAGLRLLAPPAEVYSDSAIIAARQAVQSRIAPGTATAEAVYDPEEIKVLRAAARASRRTGAALTDQLLDRIAWAVREGFGGQILVSLDLCFRQSLTKYGGGGYRTLFERIIPALQARGVGEAAIRRIVVENPRRVLTLAP